jgi:phosphoribosylamine---glycine ligase
MRFLGVGETGDLGALYMRLADDGHEVRLAVTDPDAAATMAGLVRRTPDWRAELDWIRQAKGDGIILFEAVSEGFGALQDQLRLEGFNVIGGSAYGDRLENDRAFAQEVLADIGFPRGHVWRFDSVASAADFISARPGRYVLKFCGPDHASSDTYIGQLQDGHDVRAVLLASASPARKGGGPLILMEFIEGIEMGVGAYFNGEHFLTPACLDWEHKRFFAGDLGELTGEMGTVATYDRSGDFFHRTLAKMERRLRENGYVGYINLNTIVNENGIWPLEFTCRFGYPGFAVLDPLQQTSWAELFRSMAGRSSPTLQTTPGFSVGVVVTIPPFPYTRKQIPEPIGLPIIIEAGADQRHFHFGEIGLDETGRLVTAGLYGWSMVVTGVGATIADAQRQAYEHLKQVVVPNARYRLDIGDRLIDGDYDRLVRLGFV